MLRVYATVTNPVTYIQRKHVATFGASHEIWHQLMEKTRYYLIHQLDFILRDASGQAIPLSSDNAERQKAMDKYLFTPQNL